MDTLKTSQTVWSTPEGSEQAKATNPESSDCCTRASVLNPNRTSQQLRGEHKKLNTGNYDGEESGGMNYQPGTTRGDIGVNPKTSQQVRDEHKRLDTSY